MSYITKYAHIEKLFSEPILLNIKTDKLNKMPIKLIVWEANSLTKFYVLLNLEFLDIKQKLLTSKNTKTNQSVDCFFSFYLYDS